MSVEIVFNAAGGLALFLLAMSMMTDGLKVFGGQGLKVLLRDWTSTAFRGVFSGALVTAIVQSSSAVTVATIGFVNAGVLSLRQALGVIYGANVGTTMTGWLVSLVGVGLKIEAFALPILAIGVALNLTSSRKRYQGLGLALAGFGLFFLGLAILKDAFSGLADSFGTGAFDVTASAAGLFLFVAIGFMATVLTQSSSAAIAIILTAASQSVISVESAAAAIIGANVGTTSTALLATLGATPNAKRVAAGHLAFNLITGLIALLILPAVLSAIAWLGNWGGLSDQPAPVLALFHTTFNVLGIALLLPFAGSLADRLDRLFRTEDEDLSRPQYLDKTVLATPTLAIEALHRELQRLFELVSRLAATVTQSPDERPIHIQRRSEAAFALVDAIGEFATSIRMENLQRADAEELPRILRIARYLEEAARLAPDVKALREDISRMRDKSLQVTLESALEEAPPNLNMFTLASDSPKELAEEAAALESFLGSYQSAKSALLAAAATRSLSVEQVETMLDALSRYRRMIEQLVKAKHMLNSTKPCKEPSTPAEVEMDSNAHETETRFQ